MSPFKRGSKWYVEWTDERGDRQRKSSKARTKTEAELIEAELRVGAFRAREGLSIGSRNPTKITLLEGAEKYYLPSLKNEGTRSNQTHLVNKHIKRAGFGDLLLEHVTTALVEGYLQKLEAKKATPGTVNRVRSCFSAIFRVVKKLKLYHGENPIADVEMRQEPEHADRLIAPELVLGLIENAPDEDWRLVLALAAYCGMRRGEIRRLDLNADVDLNARVLVVRKSKTGRVRRVGIHRDLVPMIDKARERDLVLSSRTWQKSHVVVKDALGDDEAVFHGLRHTWSSHLVDCGARESVVDFMGWGKDRKSTFRQRYLEYPNARLVEEIDKLVWPTPGEEGAAGAKTGTKNTAQIRHMGSGGKR